IPPRADAPKYQSADRFRERDKPEWLRRLDRAPAAFPQLRTRQQPVAARCCYSRPRDTTGALRWIDSPLLTPERGEISRWSNRGAPARPAAEVPQSSAAPQSGPLPVSLSP